ncbi:cupin domain-containing protein [Vannielia litorea]|uniref:cupin domain-containing protein n=1 Tax=Vannielia litorea TaxID=1217970 RepID=UPI001C982CDA|nr:cupin domain-containing protein [Vannielia litorea]MBY6047878.1 cupin domain-containing protein [Vannielia litorea]MBY6075292.1 cupin domain-containing protein [Vannielia litorea]
MTVKNHFPAAEGETVPAGEGLTRRVGAWAQNAMIVEVHFEEGASFPPHNHPHEQITYVISGKFEFTVGGTVYTVGPGDSLYKQPDIVHSARCLEGGTLLDVFTPHREDFL